MTAIAAVLACSTPSFGQTADAPAAEAPTPVVVPPAAAEPIVPDTTVADTPAPAEAKAKPAVHKATTAKAPAVKARPAPARVAAPAPAAVAPAPAPAAPIAAPVAAAPVVEPLPVQPEAAPPVAAPAVPAETNSMNRMMLPLAAGLAIILLAGAALLLRRRKRLAIEADELAMRDAELNAIDDGEPAMMAEPEPEPVQPTFVAAAPVIAAATVAETAPDSTPEVDGPVTELPEDFDLSRFGYNVQEAYKGPTEENASLSLKNRLSRARGMDQLERNMDAEVEAATGEPALTEDEMSPPAEASAAERDQSAGT